MVAAYGLNLYGRSDAFTANMESDVHFSDRGTDRLAIPQDGEQRLQHREHGFGHRVKKFGNPDFCGDGPLDKLT